jgi:hypothetical protein
MGDTKLDATIRARRIDLAEIELRRSGGALTARIKSEPLHRYIKALVEARVAIHGGSASQTVVSSPGVFPDLRTYRNLDTGAFRDMCGTARMTGDDGVSHIIRPTNTVDQMIQRSEPVLLSIIPLCGPHVLEGEPFRINGMVPTRQMRLMVQGWKGFIENLHREHAVPVIVGVKLVTEEYYLPAAVEEKGAVDAGLSR